MDPDDEPSRLARAFRLGREEAFPELVELLRERLYRVAFRLTGSADDAMDVVQDAFLKVYNDIHAWNERSAFYSWLYRVASNLAIDRLRRRKKDRELLNGVARERDHAEDAISALVETRETQHELGKLAGAVASLPEAQRAIVVLRHYEGLSLKEIADVRGVAVGTVKSTLHQAFRSLQSQLVGTLGTPSQLVGAPPPRPPPSQLVGAPPPRPPPSQLVGAPPPRPPPSQLVGAPPPRPPPGAKPLDPGGVGGEMRAPGAKPLDPAGAGAREQQAMVGALPPSKTGVAT